MTKTDALTEQNATLFAVELLEPVNMVIFFPLAKNEERVLIKKCQDAKNLVTEKMFSH